MKEGVSKWRRLLDGEAEEQARGEAEWEPSSYG